MTSTWTARYPDLTGKAVVVSAESGSGESSVVVEVVRALAANGALVAIVAADRAAVDAAVQVAEALEVAVLGLTADPASPTVWERVAPHIEQRLAPIDVAVAIGAVELRDAVRAALLPDMTARHRGVLIEVGTTVSRAEPPPGVRHRAIQVGPAVDAAGLAATVLLCASDSVAASSMTVALE